MGSQTDSCDSLFESKRKFGRLNSLKIWKKSLVLGDPAHKCADYYEAYPLKPGLGCHFGLSSCGKLPRYRLRHRVRARLDEFSGIVASKQLILMYPDRNTLFHSLNVIRFHCASEFFDEGMTSVPNGAGIFFCHP